MWLRSHSLHSNCCELEGAGFKVRFSVAVKTGPKAQPTSSAMVTGSFSRDVKQEGRVQHASQVQERRELYIYCAFEWYRENFTTTFISTEKKVTLYL